MSNKTAFGIGVVLLAVSVAWLGTRYAHRYAPASAESADAEQPSTDRVTVRFFRNPKPVADFVIRTIDGHEVSAASLRGKVTIVNFWATWCPPCRAEIPDLVALQEKYRDQLQIIGVSEDEGPVDGVKRFAADHHMNYPVVMVSPEIEKMFPGIGALPTSFVVNRDARVVQKHVGMLTAKVTEFETRHLAGLPVNASIEEVDQTQGLKLENGAQLMSIPGVDLGKLSPAKRAEALQKLNAQPCTCGCDLTVAKC